MSGSLLFNTIIFTLPLALSLLPKGNVLHEIFHLPSFWLKLWRVNTRDMQVEKISYGQHFRQYLLYVPPPDTSDKADKIIIYFHGGGWKFGKPEYFKASVKSFHEAGYPVILPSLRRTPHYNYYDMREDLNQILLTVLDLQRNKAWENQQIVLGGMSAGGNLAALLCLDHHHLTQLAISPSVFAGLLVLGAPLNLEKMQDNLVLRAFAGVKGSEQFRLANPIEHLQKYKPQTAVLCVHGEADGMVPYQSAATFVEIFESIQPEKIHFVSSENGTHLDAASWAYSDPVLKREILSWLKNL